MQREVWPEWGVSEYQMEPMVRPSPCSQYRSSTRMSLEPLLTVMQSSPLMTRTWLMKISRLHIGSIPSVFGVSRRSWRSAGQCGGRRVKAALTLTPMVSMPEEWTGTSVQKPEFLKETL